MDLDERPAGGQFRARGALALALALASGGCASGAVLSGDDELSSAGADAGGSADGGVAGTGAPPLDAAPGANSGSPGGLDAARADTGSPGSGLPGAVGMEAGPGRDAAGPADSGPPPGTGGGGANPEPGRLAGITAAHNAVRAAVDTATPLPPLTWSAEIAAVAQAYAQKLAATCSNSLVHSSPQERMGWGENLAMMGGFGSAPAGSAQQAVDLWESELECYSFGPFQSGTNATCSSECANYGGCGHYTQVVWRKTLRLGCGVGECSSGSSKRAFWVCNYDPPGNYIGQLPY